LRDGGRIISISTLNTRLHPPGGALYTGAKGALEHVTVVERLGRPEDIARVVAFLAGPDGAWISGQNLLATGGLLP
jgi:3-oxoacyl-[acyl-carrier protein] reductase